MVVEAAHDPADGRHFGGTLTRLLVSYVEQRRGPDAMAEVCRLAGETRPVELLRRDDTWSTHDQARRLCEAVATTFGGVGALTEVGASVWDTGHTSTVGDFLQALGSPEATFGVLAQVAARLEPFLQTETEEVAPGCWLVRVRFTSGFEPFAAHCAFASGLVGQVPTVFGHPARHVTEEACQLTGADACTFRITWDPHAVSDTDAVIADLDLRARALEGRIIALEQTVGELVSGESIDVVLGRVVEAASQAVLARGVVLAVQPGPRTWWDGLSFEDAEAVAEALLGDEPDDPAWTVVEIRSRRATYGRLVALYDAPLQVGHQRLILEAYGRVAAAALDSTAVIEEATRQADMATALLELSRSLAEIGTTEEMAGRVAAAVPAIVDCDQVVVSLREADGRQARVAAVHGYGPETDAALVGTIVPVDETFLDHEHVRVLVRGDALNAVERPLLGVAAALGSVPLHAGGEVLGWIAVIVQDRPERLLEEPHLADRLRGLAGQAATAMRNARLLDQIRYQAEHDPLTGLANQRLLHVHAGQAIARARRDGTRVGLLFLDLDDFKDVNDTLGHAEGDRLLQLVTDRLRTTLREGDTVARFGGDEFVVLLPSLTDDGGTVGSKITLALADRFLLGGTDVRVSTSIGTAVFPDDGNDFGELLKQADIRMYRAKVARRVRSGGA
ncbi:MAG: diguanylate cyclase with sensor [Actinomycetia bacterium]|nr:diguanylate cyclase with sensor [Actinomycetes bacterium]